MAIPTSYTEAELRTYMLSITATVAGVLDLAAADFTEAVNDTLVNYGVDTIADATDIAKLRALAKVEAWRAVVDGTAADIDFTADGSSFKRAQMHEHAKAALERAESAATSAGYGDSYAPAISVGTIVYADPYLTDEDLYDDEEDE